MTILHQLFLQSIREAEGLSDGGLARYRAPLIGKLLEHCSAHPFYASRLPPQATPEEWLSIPVLRRDDLPTLAASRPGSDAGGNEPESIAVNGWPLTFRSRLARIAGECERERFYERAGIDLAGHLAIFSRQYVAEPETGTGWSVTLPESPWSNRQPGTDRRDWELWFSLTGARQLLVDAEAGSALLECAPGIELATIIVADEICPATLRTGLERKFGAQVIHWVERKPLGPLGVSIAPGQVTLPAATMIVEVLDAGGQPATSGELVVTPLYEYAAPLLRWATGLYAEAEGKGEFGLRVLTRIAAG